MRIRIKVIIITLMILLISGGVLFYLRFFDIFRIKGVLKGAETAFTHEDIDGLMSYVSTDYRDHYGFDYPMARRLMLGFFKDFDKFEVAVKDPVIKIDDDTAIVQFYLWISVGWNGTPSYIVGTNQKGANVRLYLKKVLRKWKAVMIEGVR